MKQSIRANIGGRIFHIDDDAYNMLNKYLDSIRQYFKKAGEAEDIMEDIELRISELLFEKTGDVGIVSQRHVKEVMKEMGNPEVFSPEDNSEQDRPNDEMSSADQTARARLFRDPDDKVLGGVCSGIGHYFGIDPVWVRIGFAVAILAFGTGILFYLLLWIIIPEALSTADKLQMKGRPVNISNIEESIKEEMVHVKRRFDGFKEDAKNFKSSKHARKAKGAVHDIGDSIRNFSVGIGRSAKAILGVLLIIVTMLILFAFVASLTGFGHFDGLTYSTMSGFIFEKEHRLFWPTIALVLAFGIPLLSLLIRGMSWMLGLNHPIRSIRGVLMIIWLAAIIMLFYFGTRLANDFKYRGESNYSLTGDSLSSDTVYLSLNHPPTESLDNDLWFFHDQQDIAFIDGSSLFLKTISLTIGSSLNSNIMVDVEKFARADSRIKARTRAENINYSIAVVGNKILIDPEFVLDNDVWRNQRIKIKILIPKGKTLLVDPEAEPYIENHYVRKSKPKQAQSYQY